MLQNEQVLSINNKSLQSQQNHAIMELLLLKQQQNTAEWKRSLPKVKETKRVRKYRNQKNQKSHEQNKISNNNVFEDKKKFLQNQQAQATHFESRIYDRNSSKMINKQQKFSDFLTKKYAEAQLSNNKVKKYAEAQINGNNKSKKLYMNRTNYWIGYNKKNPSKQDQIKRRQRNYSYLQQTSAFFHRKDQQREQSKSYLDSYNNATKNQARLPQSSHQKPSSACPILLRLNKSLTVRQMLCKIKSNQNISLKQQAPTVMPQKHQRNPFDPYIKPLSKQHYKKFMPFKMEQEKRIELSINKLEQRLNNNPEMHIQDIQIKYLDKPNYCSWVQKNRQRARRRSYLPPTVRQIKMAIE